MGLADPSRGEKYSVIAQPGAQLLGIFHPHQDFHRTPRLWPLRLLGNQGLGGRLLGQGAGLGGSGAWLRAPEDPCPRSPEALLAAASGASEHPAGPWDLVPRTASGKCT